AIAVLLAYVILTRSSHLLCPLPDIAAHRLHVIISEHVEPRLSRPQPLSQGSRPMPASSPESSARELLLASRSRVARLKERCQRSQQICRRSAMLWTQALAVVHRVESRARSR